MDKEICMRCKNGEQYTEDPDCRLMFCNLNMETVSKYNSCEDFDLISAEEKESREKNDYISCLGLY